MVVSVLVGARFSPRQHVFDAVIDKVDVKTIGELSPNEIEHDNPEIRPTDELCKWLSQLYNRDVSSEDTVTLIRFSAIKPSSGSRFGRETTGFPPQALPSGIALPRLASPPARPTRAPAAGRWRSLNGEPFVPTRQLRWFGRAG